MGLTLFWPVYFGAEPCVGSKTAAFVADVRAGRQAEAADRGRRRGRRRCRRRGSAARGRRTPRGRCTSCMQRLSTIRSLELDVGVLLRDLAGDAEEEAVR